MYFLVCGLVLPLSFWGWNVLQNTNGTVFTQISEKEILLHLLAWETTAPLRVCSPGASMPSIEMAFYTSPTVMQRMTLNLS